MKLKKKFKRIIIVSDTQCGSITGMTSPAYQYDPNSDDPYRARFGKIQVAMWDWIKNLTSKLQPVDILIANGDMIDGKQRRNESLDLLETDRLKQCDMAVDFIELWKPKTTMIISGTDYHTGTGEDFEKIIKDKLEAKNISVGYFGHHLWLDVYGKIIDVKHHISSSNIPHTRATSIMRQRLQNWLWNEKKVQPVADFLIRAHAHYFIGVVDAHGWGWIQPGLQGLGTRYGEKYCEAPIDVGFTEIIIYEDGTYSWSPYLLPMELFAAEPLKV